MSHIDRMTQYSHDIRYRATKRTFEARNIGVVTTDHPLEYWTSLDHKDINTKPSDLPDDNPAGEWYVESGTPAWNEVHETFAWVDEYLHKYDEPHPMEFDPLIEEMLSALQTICVDAGSYVDNANSNPDSEYVPQDRDITMAADPELNLNSVLVELKDWNGSAADNFRGEWEGFKDVMDNLFELAQILLRSVETQKAIVMSARNDIRSIAKQTLAALDTCNDSNPDDLKLGLTIGSAIITVSTLGAGMAVAAAGTVVTAGFSVTGALVPSDAPRDDSQIGGASVQEVMDSMSTECGDLASKIQGARDTVESCMAAVDTAVLESSTKNYQPQPPKESEEGNGKPADLGDATEDNVTDDDMVGHTGNTP